VAPSISSFRFRSSPRSKAFFADVISACDPRSILRTPTISWLRSSKPRTSPVARTTWTSCPTDTKDNHIVSTALEGGADMIVTEDARDLLSLKVIKIRGLPPVQVVDAKVFARQLRQR